MGEKINKNHEYETDEFFKTAVDKILDETDDMGEVADLIIRRFKLRSERDGFHVD